MMSKRIASLDEPLLLAPSSFKVPSCVIIAPTLSIQKHVVEAAKQHYPSLELVQRSIANAIPLQLSQSFAVAGPCLGAPAAAIAAETLAACGAKKIILVSVCGGIQIGDDRESDQRAHLGAFLFPRGALSEEGTSRLYGASEHIEFPASALQQKLEYRAQLYADAALIRGNLWTTDAPFRETPRKVKRFAERGAIGVEMELAPLLQLSLNGLYEFAAGFVISDIIRVKDERGDWLAVFKNDKVQSSLYALCQRAVETAAECTDEINADA